MLHCFLRQLTSISFFLHDYAPIGPVHNVLALNLTWDDFLILPSIVIAQPRPARPTSPSSTNVRRVWCSRLCVWSNSESCQLGLPSASDSSTHPEELDCRTCRWSVVDRNSSTKAVHSLLITIMAAFRAVNSTLAPKDHPVDYPGEARTPTTPRPTSAETQQDLAPSREDESTPNTPTRHSFGGLTGQRPLPSSPFSSSVDPQQYASTPFPKGALTRESSHRSVQSTGSQDVEMDDSDGGEDGSGDESGDGESGRPSKKKKGQRFFCTDFPPCTLSFTRSEHLARHIRYNLSVTFSEPFQIDLTSPGNIPESDLSNATVPEDSHG